MRFSENMGCFYPRDTAYTELPDDLIEVTLEEFNAATSRNPGDTLAVRNGRVIVVSKPALTAAEVMADLCQQIDAAADNARRAVAGDPLRAEEYKTAATEAQAFKDAGYSTATVPRTVAAWAIAGRTAQQAADSILTEAAQYNEALYLLRETRLQAKELVRQAMAADNVELAQDIAAETIASIQAAVAGIGNAKEQA